ncbi:hypothetical protein GHT06_021579 [Daphnia sinensis]|uniref:Uncharacterized protein n=1 Tax=Daphnia sinensis TaxID=1820382 RepID=A0AAD5PNT4_9CRUS|nr:hypothetical protein GHT06_021579 [Daphnia sinensis]
MSEYQGTCDGGSTVSISKGLTLFDIEEAFFPSDCYQGAVYAGTGNQRTRHLLFFTPFMKRQSEDYRTWFLDATFHFMKDSFKQLFLINGLIKNEKAEKIPFVFDDFRNSRTTGVVKAYGILGEELDSWSVLDSENWSCSNLLLRTYIDCEGLHNEWNKLNGGPKLPFYKFTMVLQQLCDNVKISQKLLSHHKIKAHGKNETRTKNSILFTLWSCYQANDCATTVIPDHPLNLNDNNIDDYDMSSFLNVLYFLKHLQNVFFVLTILMLFQ